MSDTHKVPVPAKPPRDFHFKYTVLKGYFMQSEDSTDDVTFDFVRLLPCRRISYLFPSQKKSNFGLINRDYDTDEPGSQKEQWKRFEAHIRTLVAEDPNIKVIWLGRHGQGWHNVAETKYGTKAWDVRLSTLSSSIRRHLTIRTVLLLRPQRLRRHNLGRRKPHIHGPRPSPRRQRSLETTTPPRHPSARDILRLSTHPHGRNR